MRWNSADPESLIFETDLFSMSLSVSFGTPRLRSTVFSAAAHSSAFAPS